MRRVEVKDNQPNWQENFNNEAKKLKTIFNDEIIHIHHIGSTSIQGLKAKPIIDIMVVVKNIEKVDEFNEKLNDLGYENLGENGIPKRRFFIKGKIKRTHHLHVFDYKNKTEIERHLAFKEYLKSHKEIAKEYGELKNELAKNYPEDIKSYVNGKDKYVKKIEKKAIDWYRQ
ncbi:GrpB family protein [Mammaliicoccus sciuri]|uniref:GrpB family protein n=1 Tax=Mammaliicoccus sciuri TaxID=1296 RepID=UPI00379FF5E6